MSPKAATKKAELTLDDISDFGDLVPIGAEVIVRLTDLKAKLSKTKEDGGGGKPMLELTWDVLDGEYEGLSVKQWFPLSVTEGKNKRYYARGLADLRATCKAVGQPLPANMPVKLEPTEEDARSIARLVAERLKPAVVPRARIRVIGEEEREPVKQEDGTTKYEKAYDEAGNVKMRAKSVVVGLATAAPVAAPAPKPTPVPAAAAPEPSAVEDDDEELDNLLGL